MKPATLRPLSDLPNLPGYVCELIRADGARRVVRVAVASDGCHYCATPSGQHVRLAAFVGWMPYAKPEPFAIPGHVAKGSPRLNTRDQLLALLVAWGFASETPPAKGKALLLAWPKGAPVGFPVVRVTVHPAKSTDGKTLFACQFYARA